MDPFTCYSTKSSTNRRKHSKKKKAQISNENISNPFLKAIEQPLMASNGAPSLHLYGFRVAEHIKQHSKDYDNWLNLPINFARLSHFQQNCVSIIYDNTVSHMEPSTSSSTVSAGKPKQGKWKTIENSNKSVGYPLFGGLEQPLKVAICLPSPKRVLKETFLLGLESDPNMMSIYNIVEYKTLDRHSQKFQDIKVLFPPTLHILKIQQVFNPFLRLSFQLKRNFKYFNVKPIKMFHGTKLKYVHSICTYNFNWRFNGAEKGHRYGQGVNFAPKPKFAMNFCEKGVDAKVVILADVLVIKKGVGNETLQVPPNGCDTTIRENNSTFVKFCDGEFYPSYVIFFCKVENVQKNVGNHLVPFQNTNQFM